MLTEQKIEDLLDSLQIALKEERLCADALISATATEGYIQAATVIANPPIGKNAEERAREVAVLLTDDATAKSATSTRRGAQFGLDIAKARVEIARVAIGLWKALAYQAAGHAGE